MSSLTRPRGPLPARVYWFRRLLLLGLLLGLVLGLGRVLGARGGEEEGAARVAAARPPSAASAGTTTAPAAPDRAERRGPAADRAGKPRGKRTRTPLAQPSGPCAPEDLVLAPRVREPAYAGRPVRIRLLLTSKTSPACTFEVAARTVVVRISSGDDRVWSSQDCPAAVPVAEVVARPQQPGTVAMGWRGQRSDATCSRSTAWARPGWYHVTTAVLGGEPTDVQFRLRPPVPRTVTITPSPSPSASGSPSSSTGTSPSPSR